MYISMNHVSDTLKTSFDEINFISNFHRMVQDSTYSTMSQLVCVMSA